MPLDPPESAIRFERHGDELLVTMSGEVDIEVTETLAETLFEQAASAATIVVDLTTVTFLDSTGLTVLLRLRNAVHPTPVRLVSAGQRIVRTLEAGGVITLFELG